MSESETTETTEAGSTHMSVEEAEKIGAETQAAKTDPEKVAEIEDQREAAGLPRAEMTGGNVAPSPIEAEMAQAARMLELARMQENQAEASSGAEKAQAAPGSTPPPSSSAPSSGTPTYSPPVTPPPAPPSSSSSGPSSP